jgi:hypothetical protein
MFEASARARAGDVPYFGTLAPGELEFLVAGKDEDGRTLLHTAAANGHLELLELLARAGAGKVVNKADDEVRGRGAGRGAGPCGPLRLARRAPAGSCDGGRAPAARQPRQPRRRGPAHACGRSRALAPAPGNHAPPRPAAPRPDPTPRPFPL